MFPPCTAAKCQQHVVAQYEVCLGTEAHGGEVSIAAVGGDGECCCAALLCVGTAHGADVLDADKGADTRSAEVYFILCLTKEASGATGIAGGQCLYRWQRDIAGAG